MERSLLDISWGTVVKVILAVVSVYFLYQISDILVLFIFALIISIMLNPAVDLLRRLRIPRGVAVIFIYFGFFGLLSFFIYLGIPGFVKEIREFSLLLPQYFERMSPFMQQLGVEAFESVDVFFETLRESSEAIAQNVFNVLVIIFGGMFSALFVITMSVFLSLEGSIVEKGIGKFTSVNNRENALTIWKKCRKQVSNWFLGRVLAGIFVGLLSFLVFYLFDVNYALLFALIAGLFNFIPYLGPVVSGGLFFVIIALDSVEKAVFVLIAFAIIQTIESSVLTPLLSRRFMGVSPALVLIAIVIGGSLWGALGAFLAIPILGILFEFSKEYLEQKE